MQCVVYGCNNTAKTIKRDDISYFHLPKDPKMLTKWLTFCKRKDVLDTIIARVCSEHFTPDDMKRDLQFEQGLASRKRFRLKPGTVPSVYTTKVNDEETSSIMPTKNMTNTEDEDQEENEEEEEYIETNVSVENSTELDPNNVNSSENCDSTKINLKELTNKLPKTKIKTNAVTISGNGAIRKLEAVDIQKQRYSKVDINSSRIFYSTNSKVYNLLRKRGFALPSDRTLRRRLQAKIVSPGSSPPVPTSEVQMDF